MKKLLITLLLFGFVCNAELTSNEKAEIAELYQVQESLGEAEIGLAQLAVSLTQNFTNIFNEMVDVFNAKKEASNLNYWLIDSPQPEIDCNGELKSTYLFDRVDVVACCFDDQLPIVSALIADALTKHATLTQDIDTAELLTPPIQIELDNIEADILQAQTSLNGVNQTLTYSDPLGGVIDLETPTQFGPHGNFLTSAVYLNAAQFQLGMAVTKVITSYKLLGVVDQDFIDVVVSWNTADNLSIRIFNLDSKVAVTAEDLLIVEGCFEKPLKEIDIGNGNEVGFGFYAWEMSVSVQKLIETNILAETPFNTYKKSLRALTSISNAIRSISTWTNTFMQITEVPIPSCGQ